MAHSLKTIKVTPHPKDSEMEVSMVAYRDRLHAPQFHIDARQMPEIKNWEPPNEYILVVRIKQTNKNVDENRHTAEFDIVAYKYLPSKTIEEMTDKEFGEHQGQALAGNVKV